MEISFATKELREICERQSAALASLGAEVAGLLMRRLADLRAAKSIEDLVAGQPMASPANPRLEIRLAKRGLLALQATPLPAPTNPDGTIDWPAVRRLKVVEITHAETS